MHCDPQLAEIWSNLAGVYLDMHNASEAEAASRRAVAIRPGHMHAWFNLALSLEAQEKLAEALEIVTTLARQAPAELAPAGLKASLEQALGNLDAARGTLGAAIARHPGEARLHLQLAHVEEQAKALPAAAAAYEQTLRLAPGEGAVLSDLLYLRKRMADWHDLAMSRERFRAGVAAGQAGLSPFNLLSDPSTRAEQRRCAERWSALFPMRPAAPARQPRSSGRLRIGYLSSDFYQHATAFLTAGLFEHHDRTRFEVFGYSTGRDDASAMRARLIRGFDRFTDARGWPAERIATQIRADGIDILVDLKGHTEAAPTAVLALRPAAIQVNYLGYPGSMGADFMDYLIGDPVVTPFGQAADYSETIVQLPHSYQINDSARPIAASRSRRELGLPGDAAVFCCFNSTYKLNPAVFDAWARILAAVPDSVLWLLARGEGDPAMGSLRREAAARGIAPARLVFAPYRANADYLALYRCADLFLDTWPYNAHTTASDTLWACCSVLAFLAKEIVKRIVRNFVENQMLATAGPCGMPITQPGALAGMAGLLRGRGGMPGVPNLPGGAVIPGGGIPGDLAGAAGRIPVGPAGAMRGRGDPSTMIGATPEQIAAMQAGAMPSLGDMKLPPAMAEKMQEQMARQPGATGERQAAALSGPEMAKAMAALQDSTPLSSAEVDELGTLLERMAAAMPSAAPKCKPGEMKAMLAMTADSPMGGGMLRMMLEPLRDMQRKLDEARDTFARMSEQERGEYVETMAAEFRGWDKQNRQALLGMVESNFLGMPDDMRTQLLARLKQER